MAQIDNLALVFEDDKKEEQAINFTNSPLGMTWAHHMPIMIRALKSDSIAQKHGVKVGWTIKRIQGEDIAKMRYKEATALLKRYTDGLPKQTK